MPNASVSGIGRTSVSPNRQTVNGGGGDWPSKQDPGSKDQRDGRPPRDTRPRGSNNNSTPASVSQPTKTAGNHLSGNDMDSKLPKNKLNSNSAKGKDLLVNGE